MPSSDSMMSIPSGKIVPFNQLKFRKTLLFYLKTNAKPRLLLKFMQISRYFCYREFPYMVVKDVSYYHGQWEHNTKQKELDQLLDLDNLTKPLWISNNLHLFGANNSNLISQLLSKTAVCDIKNLIIYEQHIKIDEFQVLISSNRVEDVSFRGTKIVYDDGNIVPVEEIVKMLPNLKEFSWTFNDPASEITPTSTAKLIEYINPSILTRLDFWRIPEIFDFELFTEFMDKNPSIYFHLPFNYPLSNEYVKFLRDYVDKLIETGEFKNRKILIVFPQQNYRFYKILFKHYYNKNY